MLIRAYKKYRSEGLDRITALFFALAEYAPMDP